MAVYTEIEIACSPEQVRRTFLDFKSYPAWAGTFVKSITPRTDSISPGDKLDVTLKGMSFSPVILTNTSQQFKWSGNVPYIFRGDHEWNFKASSQTPGGTTLVQSEQFTGLLSFFMNEGSSSHENTKKGFQGFNEELKRRCEGQ